MEYAVLVTTQSGPDGLGWAAWVAAGLVAVSTVAGAWTAHRKSGQLTMWLAVTSAVMMVLALADLVPDAWQGAGEAAVPSWAVVLAAAAGFGAMTCFTRRGRCCSAVVPAKNRPGAHASGSRRRVHQAAGAALYGGIGTAVALSTHRAVEGATLAVSATPVVAAALIVHSAGEGLAPAGLLTPADRRVVPWVAVACLSPAAGVLITTLRPLPEPVVPILLAVVAGVLLLGLVTVRSVDHAGHLYQRTDLAPLRVKQPCWEWS